MKKIALAVLLCIGTATHCFGNAGTITVSPTSWNFGSVDVGSSAADKTFIVTNTGSVSVTVSAITVTNNSGEFSLGAISLPKTLTEHQTLDFTGVFTCIKGGMVNDTVTITSTASTGKTIEIVLTATGLHNVVLTWTASTTSDVVSYNIYRITSSSETAPATPYPILELENQKPANLPASTVCKNTACTWTDNSVQAATSYWYYAAAVDSSNNISAPSNIVQAVIGAP